MNKIFLIGYMASGKTTVGKFLAEELQWEFIDLDQLIEHRSGLPIEQIFQYYGEKEFRKLETSALHAIQNKNKAVIATGGGTPCFNDNMDYMKHLGQVIYLQLSIEAICERLDAINLSNELAQDQPNRPLIINKSKGELRKFVEAHLESRKGFYEEAHQIQDASVEVSVLVKRIIETL